MLRGSSGRVLSVSTDKYFVTDGRRLIAYAAPNRAAKVRPAGMFNAVRYEARYET
jgi:hypothetical protein